MAEPRDFYDPWVDLYDLMVDWDKRLAGEGPALSAALQSAGARKVLDVACGTGRHMAFLAAAGFDVFGADISAEMLRLARSRLDEPAAGRLTQWSMSRPAPAELLSAGPFDAVLCLGNSFPHVVGDAEISATLGNLRGLLRPAGTLVLSLKALAVLRQAKRPYLPLVKRRADGDVFFVRFYDFQTGQADAADFHLVIVGQGHPLLKASGGAHHAVTRLRAWDPAMLGAAVQSAGFDEVRVCRDLLGTAWRSGDGEDIFVFARRGK